MCALELEADEEVVGVEVASRTARCFQRLLTLITCCVAVVSAFLALLLGSLLHYVVFAFLPQLLLIFGEVRGV